MVLDVLHCFALTKLSIFDILDVLKPKGALHFHVILFGGITPKLLEESRGFPDFCKSISKVLDSMYQSKIPCGKYLE